MKSFVKSYPDIIGYVERRSRAPTAMAPNSGRGTLSGWCGPLAKRDVRPDVPPAKGILRDDLELRQRRPQVIRIERHEEVRPGIWRHTVPGFGIEGRSRRHDAR